MIHSVIIIYSATAIFTTIAILLTFILVYRHLRSPCEPILSRHIFYILLMIPFYAINSCMTVIFPNQCLYFNAIKDSYEAFVLYRFYLLLIHYFNRDAPSYFNLVGNYNHSDIPPQLITEDFITRNTKEYFTWCEPYRPCSCCCYYSNLFEIEATENLYIWIRRFIIQYLLLRIILIFLIIPLDIFNLYHYRIISLTNAYSWLSFITNISISFAMAGTYLLILIIKPVIKEREPIIKFLSIKLLILFVFWQSTLFSILSHFRIITPALFNNYWTEMALTESLHNMIVCFELMWLSLYHIWIFPVSKEEEEEEVEFI